VNGPWSLPGAIRFPKVQNCDGDVEHNKRAEVTLSATVRS